ncbi:hypothetical protein I3271_05505 [Photobacterium leiognathi]|uniref:hypothetical protein n=1 Tax=Photobacterium leiognathi TaxID=553611 RepID=UPI001EDE12E0|nr:hypothetical protein [Photobacterium leiognathi]MCG3884137.1 hypothetical protein [Photobacterium leiognathi]
MSIKHKKVVTTFYSIVISSSNRAMPSKLNEFFSEFDFSSIGEESWQESHTVLRDYEGDFEGIEIFYSNEIEDVYRYISNKLSIDLDELIGINIKITNI